MQNETQAGDLSPRLGFLKGDGDMAAIFRDFDWDSSPLGAIEAWPQPLRTAVSILLNAHHPMYIAWGPELHLLYNDGYREILGAKAVDPKKVLGRPFREVWSEVWEIVGPMLAAAMDGQTLWFEDQEFTLTRNGFAEQVFASFSTSPIYAETGEVAGVLCICSETTKKFDRSRSVCVFSTRLAKQPVSRMSPRPSWTTARGCSANI
jgi:hypothetical protein